MSLVPSWQTAAITLVLGLAAGAFGMHVWSASEIAGLNLKIAKMETATAQTNTANAQADLKDFKTVASTINTAAQVGQDQFAVMTNKLENLAKVYKNAKPTILSADCKPGAVRVQNIAERAAAVDEATARPVPGR